MVAEAHRAVKCPWRVDVDTAHHPERLLRGQAYVQAGLDHPARAGALPDPDASPHVTWRCHETGSGRTCVGWLKQPVETWPKAMTWRDACASALHERVSACRLARPPASNPGGHSCPFRPSPHRGRRRTAGSVPATAGFLTLETGRVDGPSAERDTRFRSSTRSACACGTSNDRPSQDAFIGMQEQALQHATEVVRVGLPVAGLAPLSRSSTSTRHQQDQLELVRQRHQKCSQWTHCASICP